MARRTRLRLGSRDRGRLYLGRAETREPIQSSQFPDTEEGRRRMTRSRVRLVATASNRSVRTTLGSRATRCHSCAPNCRSARPSVSTRRWNIDVIIRHCTWAVPEWLVGVRSRDSADRYVAGAASEPKASSVCPRYLSCWTSDSGGSPEECISGRRMARAATHGRGIDLPIGAFRSSPLSHYSHARSSARRLSWRHEANRSTASSIELARTISYTSATR